MIIRIKQHFLRIAVATIDATVKGWPMVRKGQKGNYGRTYFEAEYLNKKLERHTFLC